VLVLTDGAGVDRVRAFAPDGWLCRSLEIAADGVRIG
jgi:hypothetical protein